MQKLVHNLALKCVTARTSPRSRCGCCWGLHRAHRSGAPSLPLRCRQGTTGHALGVLVNMVLVLCIGDLHIPHRSPDIPQKFKELLKPGKIHQILCTGNLCSQVQQEFLKGICADVKIVQGDFDDFEAPDHLVTTIADFKVGLCHGHQVVPWGDKEALAILQRRLDVDILVAGHTHEFKAVMYEDRLQINPGSATGAYSTTTTDVKPSFVLMDLDGSKATVYVYQLVNGEVKVEKIEYSKPSAASAAGVLASAAS